MNGSAAMYKSDYLKYKYVIKYEHLFLGINKIKILFPFIKKGILLPSNLVAI